MDKKFLKRYIEECPLTDFTDNGNVNERLLQLDEYLENLPVIFTIMNLN